MMFFDIAITDKVHVEEYKYIPLYPLLTQYWDKTLADMPEKLQLRIENAVSSWDEIIDQDTMMSKADGLTIRKNRIRWYDIKRDYDQEWETYIALQGYIQGGYNNHSYPPCEYVPGGRGFMRGYLPKQIEKAKENNNESIANVLYNDVALPLEKICKEVGIHWPNPEPLLWKALCKFREMKLSRLLKMAEEKNDKLLVDELNFSFVYIERILRLQRNRMNPRIESEILANAIAQGASFALNSDKKFDESLKQCRAIADNNNNGFYESETAVDESMRKVYLRGKAILYWLQENKHDPKHLPPPKKNGLPGIKAICKKELCNNIKLFSSDGTFEKAWQKLRDDGEINDKVI
jgi:hypothetical protein